MGNRLSPRRILSGYVVWMAVLIAAHYAHPSLRTQTAGLIEVSGVGAMAAGVYLNRPARRLPWLLLGAANLMAAASDLSVRSLELVTGRPLSFPSFADAIYLCLYPLYVGGLALFIRYRSNGRDRRSAEDALILTVGLALLSWLFLVRPDATNPSLSWLEKVVAAAYPVGDLLIFATLIRLLTPGTARGWPVRLITIGTIAALASDVTYDVVQIYGVYHEGALLLGLGWVICYAAWGAAALHPDMTELTRPAGQRAPDASRSWVIALMIASLIVPCVQFVRSVYTSDGDEGELAVACAVLFLLVLSRLWDVVISHRRSLARERTLRLTAAALASASSVEEVAAAVQVAAVTLVPGVPAKRAAVLAVREGERLRQVEPGERPRGEDQGDPVRIWMRLMGGHAPRFVTVAEIRAARQAAHLSAEGMTPAETPAETPVEAQAETPVEAQAETPVEAQAKTPAESPVEAQRTTPDPLAGVAAGGTAEGSAVGYDGALLCPLNLTDRPFGDPFIGMLAFFGNRRDLADHAGAMEILAGQTALAIERVALSEEVVRQRGQALFRTLVQDASDVILIIDDDGKITYATPSATDIFGPVPIDGMALTDLVGPTGREDVSRVLDMILAGLDGGRAAGFKLRIERLDGRAVIVEIRSSDLRHDETVGGIVLTLRDVTAQRELEDELKRRAFHDALTGLPNRAMFAERASDAIAAARRNGRVAGVVFVDLDDFKMVNDTMGHGAGDELLAVIAARLVGSVRKSDMAARFGGDEFAVLIDDAPDVAAVEASADRILAAFAEPASLAAAGDRAESTVLAAASIGVATSNDSADADELLRHADLAMYAAKAAGKRRWRRYAPTLSAGMVRRRELQAALEDAVRDSAFTLVYQPIVALQSGEIAGFEALVRWPHPEWGMILPAEFIELAEETGHIVPLGEWVLKQALTDMVTWRRNLGLAEEAVPHISVNVSARQFRDPGYVNGVRKALRQSGLPPSVLLLELTESLLLGSEEQTRADLDELKDIGVRLAIDDFGTGYSSLAYLLELPIDVLKIDKTFVTGIAGSWRRHALVQGIVALAGTLDVVVIAEGIETMTERELLAGMGCEYGQGYLLSVPVDANKAEELLRLGRQLVPQLPRQRRKPPARKYLTDP